MVRYGRSIPKGFLGVYSVDTEKEAHQLLVATCPRNLDGEFVAPELAQEQNITNLLAFGERLAAVDRRLKRQRRRKQS